MSDTLVAYLAQNPVGDVTHEVSISGRLSKFKFKIKPITANQFNKYQQLATTLGKNKDGIKFNNGRFNELILLNHVVEPNFRSTDTLASAGCSTPEEYLNKVFLAGELIELVDKISAISGFDKTDDELEDEVKNS